MKKSAFLIFMVVLILSGCDKRPDNVLSDSEMADLMTDLILAEAMEQHSMANLNDSLRATLGERILVQHGVNRATLDSTISWYSRNVDDYYRLYAKVDKRLKKMKKGVGAGEVESEQENDVWELPRYVQFSKTGVGDAFTFQLPGGIVEKGEELKWKMYVGPNASFDLLLGIDYEDGTSSFTRKEFSNGRHELSVIADTALKISRVYGFIWVERRMMPAWVDSISLIKLPFDSIAYQEAAYKKRITPPVKKIEKIEKADTFLNNLRVPTEVNNKKIRNNSILSQ